MGIFLGLLAVHWKAATTAARRSCPDAATKTPKMSVTSVLLLHKPKGDITVSIFCMQWFAHHISGSYSVMHSPVCLFPPSSFICSCVCSLHFSWTSGVVLYWFYSMELCESQDLISYSGETDTSLTHWRMTFPNHNLKLNLIPTINPNQRLKPQTSLWWGRDQNILTS